MDILKSKLVIISTVLSVLIVLSAYFGTHWAYRDIPGNNADLDVFTAGAPITADKGASDNMDDISSAKVIEEPISAPDNYDSVPTIGDETLSASQASMDHNSFLTEDLLDETASPVIDVPAHYFNPPPPPSGGINSIFAGATEDNIAERATSYIRRYYPLVGTNPALVSHNEKAKAEYARQKAALNKEMFDAVRESFSSTPPEMLETLSSDLLDELRKERLIE